MMWSAEINIDVGQTQICWYEIYHIFAHFRLRGVNGDSDAFKTAADSFGHSECEKIYFLYLVWLNTHAEHNRSPCGRCNGITEANYIIYLAVSITKDCIKHVFSPSTLSTSSPHI